MKFNACILSIAAILGLAACSAPSGQTPPPPQTTGTAAPASVTLSAQGFAGEFDGTIPCGDCQGILTKLQLNADGSYKLDETFTGRATNNFLSSNGQWQIQDDHHFVLAPSEQGWEHRPFEVLDNDDIKQLGKDGKPYSNDAAYHLKRVTDSSTH
jgi:uncharacterized lipoprotein NlpE involved in copper resistance